MVVGPRRGPRCVESPVPLSADLSSGLECGLSSGDM